MINLFNEIINYNEGDDFFDEYLEKLYIIHIFEGLKKEFPEKYVFKGVVNFILLGYSMESEMLTTNGLTWSELSKKIFEKVGLPNQYYEQVAQLESDEVRKAANEWVRYNNNEAWTQYITFRDLRSELLIASLSDVKKSSGEIDYAVKMQCARDTKELLDMMMEAQQTFIQNHNRLKESYIALKTMDKKRNTISAEDFVARM